MTVPRENSLAFFPRTVKAGNVTLRPLTLAGVVALADVGVNLGNAVSRDDLFKCAWILAGSPGTFRAFLRSSRVGLKELSTAVETVLNDAFDTFVKPAQTKGGTVSLTPHGLGRPLEYAEFLCSEYGWTFGEAINTPLATVYALEAAARQRNGGKSGLDYLEREYAKKLKSKKHG